MLDIKELIGEGKSPKEAIAQSLSEKWAKKKLGELQEDGSSETDELSSPLSRAIMSYVMKRKM